MESPEILKSGSIGFNNEISPLCIHPKNHDSKNYNQATLFARVITILTSIERKSRMPQIQGIKGEAVVNYCEPLITKKVGYHRLSRRANKMGFYS